MESSVTYNVRPANRLSEVQEYYFSRKLKEISELNKQGKNIISLAIGSPDMPPSDNIIKRLCEVASEPTTHGYQPTKGTDELLNAMALFYKRWYNVEVNAQEEILPLIGSKEGILHVTLAFVNPGDKILVPNPGYPTYTSLSKLLGANIQYYNLREKNNWEPDFDELEKTDLKNTKLMWTNYPNMPTGGKGSMETYKKLVNFARKHNIIVVNDNPYSFILNEEHLSIMQVEGAKDCCIEFNSLSKSHNMPGWRVGMCISNSTFISYILKVKSNIDSGTFRAIQLAAADGLLHNDDEWHTLHNVTLYRQRRNIAEQIMVELNCKYDKKQVGMFLWGKIPNKYDTGEELTEKVLNDAKVFITPGFIFGSNGEKYIRISLCAKEEKLREALERIRKVKF